MIEPFDRDDEEPELRVSDILRTANFGAWVVTGPLGCGGFAWVYEVVRIEDEGKGKVKAVKVLRRHLWKRKEIVARFSQESSAVIRIQHENILSVDGLFWATNTPEPIPLIFMDRVRGNTLSHLMQRCAEERQPLSLKVICSIAHGVCQGLKAIHPQAADPQTGQPAREGIIHRDLKPDNLFLDQRGVERIDVKIMDFGIVKRVGGVPAMHELREATSAKAKSRFIGTLAYAAPEQVRGDEVTVRTDVYSTGQVLWEMFAMRAMFHKGLTPEQLVAAKLKGDVPRLRKVNPTVPPPLEEVVMAALSLNPADRQQSAGELSQLFTRIVRNTSMNAGDFTAQQALLAPDPAPSAPRPSLWSSPPSPSASEKRAANIASLPLKTVKIPLAVLAGLDAAPSNESVTGEAREGVPFPSTPSGAELRPDTAPTGASSTPGASWAPVPEGPSDAVLRASPVDAEPGVSNVDGTPSPEEVRMPESGPSSSVSFETRTPPGASAVEETPNAADARVPAPPLSALAWRDRPAHGPRPAIPTPWVLPSQAASPSVAGGSAANVGGAPSEAPYDSAPVPTGEPFPRRRTTNPTSRPAPVESDAESHPPAARKRGVRGEREATSPIVKIGVTLGTAAVVAVGGVIALTALGRTEVPTMAPASMTTSAPSSSAPSKPPAVVPPRVAPAASLAVPPVTSVSSSSGPPDPTPGPTPADSSQHEVASPADARPALAARAKPARPPSSPKKKPNGKDGDQELRIDDISVDDLEPMRPGAK